eukprot:11846254-Karenia_brevis.AAC.1
MLHATKTDHLRAPDESADQQERCSVLDFSCPQVYDMGLRNLATSSDLGFLEDGEHDRHATNILKDEAKYLMYLH